MRKVTSLIRKAASIIVSIASELRRDPCPKCGSRKPQEICQVCREHRMY